MTTGEGWAAWPAPAKLNLFLRITGRRDDGFHQLQTAFQLLDWGDTVHVRARPDGLITRAGGDTAGIDEDQDLVLRAARLLQQRSGSTAGADLAVTKRIPIGGGFGGGSSDAATVLVALAHLWDTGLGEQALADLGRQLGADVPVFVRGRTAWAEGIGEVLTPLETGGGWFLLAFPGVGISTRDVFQAPELTRDAPPATIADFVSGTVLGNAFEPVVRRLQPAVDRALHELARHGQASLTGTGSGCFVRFASEPAARRAQRALPADLESRVVAGVSRSPLLDALDRARGGSG